MTTRIHPFSAFATCFLLALAPLNEAKSQLSRQPLTQTDWLNPSTPALTSSPSLTMALEQEKERVLAQRVSRKKAKTVAWLATGIGCRVASRQAYDAYLESVTPNNAQTNYVIANTCHKASFGFFALAGLTWTSQIFTRSKS